MGRALVLLGGIAAAVFCASGCEVGHFCTLVGCTSGEEILFDVPRGVLSEADLEVCRNSDCWHAHVVLSTVVARQYVPVGDGNPDGSQISIEPLAQSFRFSITSGVKQYSDVQKGDLMKVTFTDGNGMQLLEVSGTTDATSDFYPNGRECDDTPCRNATVNLTAS